jgi:hypothetical protein
VSRNYVLIDAILIKRPATTTRCVVRQRTLKRRMFSLQRQVGPPDSTYHWLFRNWAANLFRFRLPPAANVKHLTVKLFPVSYSYICLGKSPVETEESERGARRNEKR